MINLIKKTVLKGIGIAYLSKDTLKNITNELKNNSKLSEAEGEKLLNELVAESIKAKKTIETNIEKVVLKILNKLNMPNNQKIEELENRIKELEKKYSEK